MKPRNAALADADTRARGKRFFQTVGRFHLHAAPSSRSSSGSRAKQPKQAKQAKQATPCASQSSSAAAQHTRPRRQRQHRAAPRRAAKSRPVIIVFRAAFAQLDSLFAPRITHKKLFRPATPREPRAWPRPAAPPVHAGPPLVLVRDTLRPGASPPRPGRAPLRRLCVMAVPYGALRCPRCADRARAARRADGRPPTPTRPKPKGWLLLLQSRRRTHWARRPS